jgi:hypothetical protein
LVTLRIRPLRIGKRVFEQIGLPYHWGGSGRVRGDGANELLALAADPNVSIMNSKAHTANIEPGRRVRNLPAPKPLATAQRLPGDELRDLPAVRAHRHSGPHHVVTSEDKQGDQT